MFFDDWDSIIRVISIGTLAYVGLVCLLRASGNRTLSKMNSFDLVVTVAFGSVLATILTSQQLSLAAGLTAIALLVLLQFLITWTSVRSGLVDRLVKTRPTLLLRNGALRTAALRRVRVTEEEVRSAVRQHGYGDLNEIAAVVMESDGSLSVIARARAGSGNAFQGVLGYEKGQEPDARTIGRSTV